MTAAFVHTVNLNEPNYCMNQCPYFSAGSLATRKVLKLKLINETVKMSKHHKKSHPIAIRFPVDFLLDQQLVRVLERV